MWVGEWGLPPSGQLNNYAFEIDAILHLEPTKACCLCNVAQITLSPGPICTCQHGGNFNAFPKVHMKTMLESFQ